MLKKFAGQAGGLDGAGQPRPIGWDVMQGLRKNRNPCERDRAGSGALRGGSRSLAMARCQSRDHRGRRRFRPAEVDAFRTPARTRRNNTAAKAEQTARREAARRARLEAPELGASDAARFLGYASPISVWRLANAGKLPFTLDDRGRRRFVRAELEAFKAKHGKPRRGRPNAAQDGYER